MNTKGIQKIGDVLTKNSPTILTGLGVAGLVSTAIMAVKSTPKALQIIEELEYPDNVPYGLDEDGDVLNGIFVSKVDGRWVGKPLKKDIIKSTYKCYIPAGAMGIVTIACIIGANSINLRRNAALASVYTLSEAALKEYQAKVIETIGSKKERQIKDDIAKDKIARNPVNDKDIIITGHGETLCYDAFSGRYFKSDIETIRKAINDLNRTMMSEHFITLNEVYYAIDLAGVKMGDLLGWHVDSGLIEPDFSSQLTEKGTPCLVLDFDTEPRYNIYD